MKLEIDIDGDYYKIICKRVEENKPYHSPYEYEVIADGKPIEQEPKTGRWIYVGEENEEETKNGNFRYVCSECGFSDVHAKTTYVPYCWHCGAKMAESEGKE